ncbi:MAG: formyltransferase family protein [Minisyncoccia bacterium]
MSIVVITIPGEAKRVFANSLHRMTGEKVELVIIQKRKANHNSIFNRLKRLYKSVGLKALPIEIWHAILLRVNGQRSALEYFRERTETASQDLIQSGYGPRVLEVQSVNSDEVFEILRRISPDLMVIWGGTVIKPHIIGTAKRAVNLHMGLCPYYRGAIANQNAVMRREFDKIGATIHYAEAKVDSGDILETITVDVSKKPREMFRELNDRAEERYLDIAYRLSNGEILPKKPQSAEKGENFLLKDWTPKVRYNLARQVMEWESA